MERLDRYAALCERRAGTLVLLILCLGVLALVPLRRLSLNTDMAELLPQGHEAVRALRQVAARQRSASNLILLVRSPDPEANRRFARALLPRLQALVPGLFTEVVSRPSPEIADFTRRWRWLYADLGELRKAEELLDRVRGRSSPLFVDLGDDPEVELEALRRRLEDRAPPRPAAAFFEGRDPADGQSDLGILLWRRREGLATAGERGTLQAVQAVVRAAAPRSFHPRLTVAYTGHIAQAIEEQDGIREDLGVATAVCALLVLLVLYLHFRRPVLLAIVLAPAVLGVVFSLCLAAFTLRALNVNTAFLISIILGNGINAPIVLLSRYGEERGRGLGAGEALRAALRGALRGTLAAAVAASIAYGSLLLTSFRGFSQFGLIGGAGMLLTLLLTFLLVPPLLCLAERRVPAGVLFKHSLWERPFSGLASLTRRRAGALSLLCVIVLGLLTPALVAYARDPIEWDLNNLRTDDAPSSRLWQRVEALGMGDPGAGYIGAHAVLLVDTPGQAEPVAQALLAKDRARGADHVLRRVRTLASLLPQQQDEKLAVLGRIRAALERARAHLTPAQLALRPPDDLRPLTARDLPRPVLRAFTEQDGSIGRMLLIDIDPATYSDWDGKALLRLVGSLRVQVGPRTWVAASAPTVFAGMLEAVLRDGLKVALAAAAGVAVLLLLCFGPGGAGLVLAAVAAGLLSLGGLLGLLQLRLNFMNFVALPITLGVGADYAANLWARLREGAPEGVLARGAAAVALCSATTVIGYSTLLLSRNRALRSFGLLADLGEITCLLTALLLLPGLAAWYRRRGGARRPS